MNRSASPPRPRDGFTLVEVTVSLAIVSVMLVIFGTMIAQMNQAWISGQAMMQNFQNGRAILEIMARELAPAGISQKGLQFVENPAYSGTSNLTSLLAGTSPAVTQTSNSDSLFWQRPFAPNSYGNMYETGYFLTTVAATATIAKKYQLVRFNLAPNYMATDLTTQNKHGGATASANTSLYWVLDPPTAYNPNPTSFSTSWPEYSDAPWLTTLTAANFQSACAVVSNGVIGLWIRCLDKNGDPIPWLYQQSSLYTLPTNSQMKFNSAASFSPAILGTTMSFAYTSPPAGIYYSTLVNTLANAPSGTVAANRLPSAVELTIVTVDSVTLARNPTIPVIPASISATDVPTEIQNFMNSLLANKVKTARVFSTTVRLVNGTD